MRNILSIFLLLLIASLVQAQPSSDKLIRQGASFHDKGRYMDAISCYQQALKVNPSSMSAVYEMSLSYLKMGDNENAIKHSTQVINVGFKPLLVDAYVVKGTALANQKKSDDAIALFTQAITRCGSEYLLHYNLGLSYYNKGNVSLALFNLRKAIELDTTHSSAFLLYASVLKESGQWVQSFYSYHFFLLLEPNTKRSMQAFGEMYNLISTKMSADMLKAEEGLDRNYLYNTIWVNKTAATDRASRYKYFHDSSEIIFSHLYLEHTEEKKGPLWEFFAPVYAEILKSGHFDTYCRYVSVAYFPESLQWWDANKQEVDNFIEWFETGEARDSEEDAYFDEDDSAI